MVKLDNWQTKAEKAVERRIAAKQRKQQRDRTRSNKVLSQKLFALLDLNTDRLLSNHNHHNHDDLTMHVWTDIMPKSYCNDIQRNLQEEEEEEADQRGGSSPSPTSKKGRRPRSKSDAAAFASPTNRKGRRPRSNSELTTPTSSAERKRRARSNSESSGASIHSSSSKHGDSLPNRMCCNFFFGKCAIDTTALPSKGGGGKSFRGRKSSSETRRCDAGEHSFREQNQSLAEVLLSQSSKTATVTTPQKEQENIKKLEAAKVALSASHTAAVAAATDGEFPVGTTSSFPSMDRLYYIPIALSSSSTNENNKGESSPSPASNRRLSEIITRTLSNQHNCTNGSIVYVVLNGMLIFDRYRDGIAVLSEDDQNMLFYNTVGSKRRSVSIGEDYEEHFNSANTTGSTQKSGGAAIAAIQNGVFVLSHQRHQQLVKYLPGQVLEYVLRYLPDHATARLPLVCKSWNAEIGRSSPALWKHLMDRRGWPYDRQSINTSAMQRDTCRNTFCSHYRAVRTITGVVRGLRALGFGSGGGNRNSSNNNNNAHTSSLFPSMKEFSNKDTAVVNFKDVFKSSSWSSSSSSLTFVRVWSPARVLLAHRSECTLHLFDTTETNHSRGGAVKGCRQRVRVSVAPFPSSKKRECCLVAIDLDENLVGCLYKVCGNNNNNEYLEPETWLGVVQRNDILCASDGGSNVSRLEKGALCTFNLQEKVLHYFLTSDDVEIMDWLYNRAFSGETNQIDLASSAEICIEENIVACGNGQFLFEAAILLPILWADEDSMDAEEDVLSSAIVKVFCFSSFVGEIIWVGPQTPVVDSLDFPSLASRRVPRSPSQTTGYGERNSARKMTQAVFLSSSNHDIITIDVDASSGDIKTNSISGGTELSYENVGSLRGYLGCRRVACVTKSYIVIAECYSSHRAGDVPTIQTEFFFHPFSKEMKVTKDSHTQHRLIVEGDCLGFPLECFQEDHIIAFCEESLRSNNDNDFGGSRMLSALLIHIPSREIVHGLSIGEMDFSNVHSFSMAIHGNSVALSAKDVGMVIAGPDVASEHGDLWEKKVRDVKCGSRFEKKNKKRTSKLKKKDGYARGMRVS